MLVRSVKSGFDMMNRIRSEIEFEKNQRGPKKKCEQKGTASPCRDPCGNAPPSKVDAGYCTPPLSSEAWSSQYNIWCTTSRLSQCDSSQTDLIMAFEIYIPSNLTFQDYLAVCQCARTLADGYDRKVSLEWFPKPTPRH